MYWQFIDGVPSRASHAKQRRTAPARALPSLLRTTARSLRINTRDPAARNSCGHAQRRATPQNQSIRHYRRITRPQLWPGVRRSCSFARSPGNARASGRLSWRHRPSAAGIRQVQGLLSGKNTVHSCPRCAGIHAKNDLVLLPQMKVVTVGVRVSFFRQPLKIYKLTVKCNSDKRRREWNSTSRVLYAVLNPRAPSPAWNFPSTWKPWSHRGAPVTCCIDDAILSKFLANNYIVALFERVIKIRRLDLFLCREILRRIDTAPCAPVWIRQSVS